MDIFQFFKHSKRIIEEKRGNELSGDYKSSHKLARLKCELSSILIQMGKIHTHRVFGLFKNELTLFLA